MAEFNLHVRVDPSDCDSESVEQILTEIVDSRSTVEFGASDPVSESNDGLLESVLEIDDVDEYAAVYQNLRGRDESFEVGLWGPTSERFAVPVKHYALQQISAPDLYEYYALDGQVTLVICDSQHLVEQLRMEVPPPALG